MPQTALLSGLSSSFAGKIRPRAVFVLIFFSIQVGPTQAHGAHVTFISPDNRAPISGDLLVHIKKLAKPVPYAHLTVRNVTTGIEEWSGLVAESHAGYTQRIELDGWATGPYDIEVQLVGDIVEQVQKRRVTVVASGSGVRSGYPERQGHEP